MGSTGNGVCSRNGLVLLCVARQPALFLLSFLLDTGTRGWGKSGETERQGDGETEKRREESGNGGRGGCKDKDEGEEEEGKKDQL